METTKPRTFMAIATFVGLCNTLRTVPYAPLPSSSSNCNCDMLIENDAPLLKLTPCACSIAFPPKWSAPDASLHQGNKMSDAGD